MTTVSIIGSGNMAAAIGTRALEHDRTVELISRTPAKAQALADRLGNGAAVGKFGPRSAGEVAVPVKAFPNLPPRHWPERWSSTRATTVPSGTAHPRTRQQVGSP